ncbi:hypothetical protein AVEN_40904-1 [Araneus ventricosus]|uniref:Uncharacterized protein n=1 Tax=Araneus ventricosus TaxID=182803 RepID=A0A4Y2L4R7_ARAVE|nr:hypothetical protein AVEN_40904-1 [Araneus ventricosus]
MPDHLKRLSVKNNKTVQELEKAHIFGQLIEVTYLCGSAAGHLRTLSSASTLRISVGHLTEIILAEKRWLSLSENACFSLTDQMDTCLKGLAISGHCQNICFST